MLLYFYRLKSYYLYMPKVVEESERRVVLNCLVAPGTMAWLKAYAGSQGAAVDFVVSCASMAEDAVSAVLPARKLSKKARAVAELAASDLTAQAVERGDIEYGTHTELPQGQHVATLDAVGPPASGGQGKASTETWRANRAARGPLLKHKDRK